jgi:protein-tyrosine phosphatase
MVDIHTHILPEVDDCARSWEMAVHMCHMAAQDGITHMVATPHANDEYFYERPRLENLLQELSGRVGPILKFSLGCDFHFSYDNLAQLDVGPQQFTITGTQYLLVELSDYSIPPWVTAKLQQLLDSGIQPIITHPERNVLLQGKPEQVLRWAEMGCPVQLTGNSLTGRWGEKALKTAHWLLRKQAVHVIASDCHNVEGRSPVLSPARKVLEQKYGVEVARALFADNPQAIVSGLDLPYFPQPKS